MKVLMTSWSFYPAQEGGPSNALYWLASGLAKEGYKLKVVTTDRHLPKDSVPVNQWYSINGFDVIYQSLDQGKSLLKEEVKECDLFLTDGVCKIVYFKAALAALRYNKKVLLSPRGELFESAINHKGWFYGRLKKIYIFFMRLSFRGRVWFHATSEEEKEAVYRYFGRKAKVQVIPNYMILPDIVEDQNKAKEYLLYVGRLNPIKNIDVLIKGLSKSDGFMKSGLVLKIAGGKEGSYYEYLKEMVSQLGLEEKVEFVGHITGKTKDLLYANAKCLFLVSKSENFGNVVIEALRQGTPVIASKGTPWESLSSNGAGYWIDASADDISEVVDKLMDMGMPEYRRMRSNASALAKTFDIFSNMSTWNEYLTAIMN